MLYRSTLNKYWFSSFCINLVTFTSFQHMVFTITMLADVHLWVFLGFMTQDETCCFQCSMVCVCVCVSVCLSVGRSQPWALQKQLFKQIEVPFGMWTSVGAVNHVLDGGLGLILQWKGQFGDITRSIVKYREYPRCGQCSLTVSVYADTIAVDINWDCLFCESCCCVVFIIEHILDIFTSCLSVCCCRHSFTSAV